MRNPDHDQSPQQQIAKYLYVFVEFVKRAMELRVNRAGMKINTGYGLFLSGNAVLVLCSRAVSNQHDFTFDHALCSEKLLQRLHLFLIRDRITFMFSYIAQSSIVYKKGVGSKLLGKVVLGNVFADMFIKPM